MNKGKSTYPNNCSDLARVREVQAPPLAKMRRGREHVHNPLYTKYNSKGLYGIISHPVRKPSVNRLFRRRYENIDPNIHTGMEF